MPNTFGPLRRMGPFKSLVNRNMRILNPTLAVAIIVSMVLTGVPIPVQAASSTDAQAADSAGPGSATSGHQLNGQAITMYGAVSCVVAVSTHDNAVSGSGDDQATVVVTYSVSSLASARKVQVLFGGHIAASDGPRGWGG